MASEAGQLRLSRARRGCSDRAGQLLNEAAPWLAQAGPWFSELGLYIRAVMAVRRGNANEAIRFVRESLARILELQDKFAFVYALVPLAAAAVLKGDDEWAARSLGARDAITERTGAALLDPSVADLHEQAERGARARLGPARWAARMRQAAASPSAACSSKSMRRDYPDRGDRPHRVYDGRSWGRPRVRQRDTPAILPNHSGSTFTLCRNMLAGSYSDLMALSRAGFGPYATDAASGTSSSR